MRIRVGVAVALAAVLMVAGIAQAQEASPWLHIRVTEEGDSGARVSVNLPVSLIQVFADVAEQEIERELSGDLSRVRFGRRGHDLQVADLRRAWSELRGAGDAEFVEIREGDDYVRISRAGDAIHVEFDDAGDRSNGRVEVPVAVVDALLSGEGERLNIRAAIDAMIAGAEDGELVFVEDGDTTIRIWIE